MVIIWNFKPVLSDLAKFCHFGNIFKFFGNILKVYLIFGKLLNLLWPKICCLGKLLLLQMAKY